MKGLPETIYFVHQQPHPSHEIWAKKVGAKFIHFRGHERLRKRSNWNFLLKIFRASLPWQLPGLIISEGGAPLNTSVILHNYAGAPIIMILADETALSVKYNNDVYSKDIKAFLQLVDGAVSVSNLATESFTDLMRENIPVEIVRPSVGYRFINADIKELPGKPFKMALAVRGGKRGITGKIPNWFEELCIRLQKRMPDLEILIAGTDEFTENVTNVKPAGLIPYNRMIEFYQSVNLLLHIPDFDTFAVVPVEALACGTPALVSKRAGVYEFFEENGLNDLIIDALDPDLLSERIIDALHNPPDESERRYYKKLIKDNLSPEVSADNFKSALERIYNRII